MAEQTEQWFLRGNWRPMLEERTENELQVQGNIPPELQRIPANGAKPEIRSRRALVSWRRHDAWHSAQQRQSRVVS